MANKNESNVMEEKTESTAGNGDLHAKANRVIAFLSQIAECLEETEMEDMNEILLGVFEVSKEEDSAETREKLMLLYSRFFEIVEFHSGISVNLIDQVLRSFKMIAMDAFGLGNPVSEKYMEMILMEHPSLGTDMKLTPELLRAYFRLLKEGSEEVCHIRLMVVGTYGVGKSTLVKRLCKEPIDNVKSTVGIDILTNSCEINDDGDWEISKKDEKDRFFQERLQVMVNKSGKREKHVPRNFTPLPPEESVAVTEPLPPQYQSLPEEEEKLFVKQVMEKRKNVDTGVVADLIKADKENIIPERKPTVSIWDFAGQSVYYSTHHFFLNARSIYLVVLDLSKKLGDKVDEEDCMGLHKNLVIGQTTECLTCHDAFKFWMRSIFIYTEQKKREQGSTYKPTIILIGTHKDMITGDILKRKTIDQYKDDYFDEALKCFRGKPILDLVHHRKFFVGIDDAKETFLEIKKEIYNTASKTEFWKEPVPVRFIRLEKVVNEKKNQEEQFMTFKSLEEADEGLKLPKFEPNDIKLFLRFQHAFGNVLYYNHDQLDKMIILNPQWIIDIFKIFITHQKDRKPGREEVWTNFKEYGTLDNALINDMLQGKDLADAENAIQYMECLNVMVRPVEALPNEDMASVCQSQENAEGFFSSIAIIKKTVTKFYIMPCMLPQRPEDDKLMKLFAGFGTNRKPPTLCMYIKKGFLPPFVFHCIIATCIKELPISKRNGQRLLFRGLGEFLLEKTTRLLIWFVDDYLQFTVIFEYQDETYERKVKYCKDLKKCFEMLVLSVFNIHGKDTFEDRNKSSLFEYLVRCPKCPQQIPFQKAEQSESYMDEFVNVTDIELSRNHLCSICCNVVTMEEALEFWFHIESQESHRATCYKEASLDLESPPTDKMLVDLAEHIGNKILPLTTELRIPEAKLHQIKNDYKTCEKTIAFHILYSWREHKKQKRSLKDLRDAIERSGLSLDPFYRIVAGIKDDVTKEAIESCMEGLDAEKFHNEMLWRRVMPDLVNCIRRDYWLLGIRLGLSETELQQRAGDDVRLQIMNILTTWWHPEAKLDDLIEALVKSECDMQEVKKALIQSYSI